MYQLLLDSANKLLVVALAKEKKVVDSIIYEAWQRQSEMMVPEIDNIMKRNSVKKEDIDAICVGIGPGSYTGTRIAITIAKTMGYALKCNVYKVSSLSLFKDSEKPTICLLNARSNRTYFGVYNKDKTIEKDQILENEDVLQYIKFHPDFLVSGECEHLNLKSINFDIARELVNGIRKENLVDNIFKLDPIYLKELYKWLEFAKWIKMI